MPSRALGTDARGSGEGRHRAGCRFRPQQVAGMAEIRTVRITARESPSGWARIPVSVGPAARGGRPGHRGGSWHPRRDRNCGASTGPGSGRCQGLGGRAPCGRRTCPVSPVDWVACSVRSAKVRHGPGRRPWRSRQDRGVLGRPPQRQGLAAHGDNPGRTAALGSPSVHRHRGRPGPIVRPLRWRAPGVLWPTTARLCAPSFVPLSPLAGTTRPWRSRDP